MRLPDVGPVFTVGLLAFFSITRGYFARCGDQLGSVGKDPCIVGSSKHILHCEEDVFPPLVTSLSPKAGEAYRLWI